MKFSVKTERTPLLDGETGPTRKDDDLEASRQPTDEASSSGDVPISQEISLSKLIIVMSGISMCIFLSALDSTIVATLSGPISDAFNSFTLLSWLATAYMVANAGIQPLSGKLTDIYSRRTGIIWANTLFGTGTLICGIAQDEWTILLGRVIAGLGGGCLLTISNFIMTDLIPLRRRAMWGALGTVFYGLGVGLGGVLGGVINDTLGWRWAFLIQLPIIAVSGLVVALVVDIPVKETDKSRIKRIDFLGAVLLVASLVLLLLGLSSGGNTVPWNHPLVYVSLPLSGMLLLLFIYVEDQVAMEPIIPVRLILNRTVLSACLSSCFGMMAYYSILYYGLIFFQLKGQSVSRAGFNLLPVSLGTAVGSLGAGVIIRATGKYIFVNIGVETVYLFSGGLIAAYLNFDSNSEWAPVLGFFGVGFGANGMLTVTVLALIAAVRHEFQAVVTSASYAFRSTGSTVGVALSSAVFQNILQRRLSEYLRNTPDAAEIIRRVRDSMEQIKLLPPGTQESVLNGYMDALQAVWYTVFGMMALCALCSLLMRSHTLYDNLARQK